MVERVIVRPCSSSWSSCVCAAKATSSRAVAFAPVVSPIDSRIWASVSKIAPIIPAHVSGLAQGALASVGDPAECLLGPAGPGVMEREDASAGPLPARVLELATRGEDAFQVVGRLRRRPFGETGFGERGHRPGLERHPMRLVDDVEALLQPVLRLLEATVREGRPSAEPERPSFPPSVPDRSSELEGGLVLLQCFVVRPQSARFIPATECRPGNRVGAPSASLERLGQLALRLGTSSGERVGVGTFAQRGNGRRQIACVLRELHRLLEQHAAFVVEPAYGVDERAAQLQQTLTVEPRVTRRFGLGTGATETVETGFDRAC